MNIANANDLSSLSGSVPSFIIDRKDFNVGDQVALSPYPWDTGKDTILKYIGIKNTETPLVDVGLTQSYNSNSREITVTVKATFSANVSSECRLNCYVIEDSVTGGPEYDQANSNFSGWTDAPDFLQPLVTLPFTIEGYVHNHVARAFLGGTWGLAGSVPSPIISGTVCNSEFSYTIPADQNPKKISLLAIVSRYNSDPLKCDILNGYSEKLLSTVDNIQIPTIKKKDIGTITLQVLKNGIIVFYIPKMQFVRAEAFNLHGKKIGTLFNKQLPAGEFRHTFNRGISTGVYIIKIIGSSMKNTSQHIIY